MPSHTAITNKDTVKRFWYLHHIRTKQDALLLCVGDVLEYGPLSLHITHIGQDQKNYPVWVGRIFGAKEKYGLDDNDVIAWGRKGVARSLPYYLEGNYYTFTHKKSYLWT